MDENERDRRRALRRKKRQRQVLIGRLILVILLVVIAALAVFLVKDLTGGKKSSQSPVTSTGETTNPGESEAPADETGNEVTEPKGRRKPKRAWRIRRR